MTGHGETTTVGVYEAKARLSDLIRRVRSGGRVIITRHDQPVAELIPDDVTLAKAREIARRIPKDLAVIEAIAPDGRDFADDVIELFDLLAGPIDNGDEETHG